uniref:Uncharacterized protein n=1 Tax=Arundo donax TaxID=35708 RepID=A0A0A9FLB0_ARUDO
MLFSYPMDQIHHQQKEPFSYPMDQNHHEQKALLSYPKDQNHHQQKVLVSYPRDQNHHQQKVLFSYPRDQNHHQLKVLLSYPMDQNHLWQNFSYTTDQLLIPHLHSGLVQWNLKRVAMSHFQKMATRCPMRFCLLQNQRMMYRDFQNYQLGHQTSYPPCQMELRETQLAL